ncbi:hypothetical protein, partial [uncultured Adlercreutzia sp.]|uniref:hypothetical protein n=1 Tax=uncultured Adlercreutzia sp. TaxID=875803 RepID=UPI002675C4A6
MDELLIFLSTILSSLLCACFVAYVFDLSSYKRDLTQNNAAEVLEVLFHDEGLVLSNIPAEVLQSVAQKAMRSTMDIEPQSVGDNLIRVCLDEVRDTVNGPYADLTVQREYSFDSRNSCAVYVKEHLIYKFYSLSDEKIEKSIWRNLTSGIID